MEADLSRFYGIDYRDRWRLDQQGRRKLTLRMIYVRVRHLPVDSDVAALDGRVPWSRTEHLLDELRRAIAGLAGDKKPKPHPDRLAGQSRDTDPTRVKKLAAARARAAKRRRQIELGEIT